jgi:threonine/homoserine/homoserine lactone efflux protein
VIGLDNAVGFFAVSVLLALAPGPDNVFVLIQSALRGPGAGLRVVLGLCTGLLVHTAAVAAGLAALFAASATAFTVVKWFGAGYLVWLAWQALRAPVLDPGAPQAAPADGWAMYRRGIVMNLSNPKVAIFFLAFLPQFTDPARGAIWPQVSALGALFIVATLLVFGGIAWFAGSLGQRLRRSPRVQHALNRIAGGVFLLLALRLAVAER